MRGRRDGRHYVPGLKYTIRAWLRLYEEVQAGMLSGQDDGEPPARAEIGLATG